MTAAELPRFKALIKERCGLLFENTGEEKLVQALGERCGALGIALPQYFSQLLKDEGEFQELVNLLTINETYFFREPEQIRLLVDRLAPRFLAAHGGHAPVRILSAGCSSGEEPYSLAMALLDKYGASVSRLFAFAGGDIDSAVLTKARSGRYTEFSFRGVPADIRQRYFERDRWGLVLKPEVRNLVTFHELNLLASELPAALRDFDIVFFRNVSIYFDTPTRQLIQRNIASLMKPDGVLVIGTAETLANDFAILPLVEEDGLFYFVKGQPPLPEAPARSTSRPSPLPPAPLPAAPLLAATAPPPRLIPPGDWNLPAVASPVPTSPAAAIPPGTQPVAADPLTEVREQVRDKRYASALPLLDTLLAASPDHAEARLLKAHVLLERKDFAAAEALARQVLHGDNWSVDACLLLGLAAKWQNQADEAIRWFKQAVYACQECWPAHYFLADLHRHGGAVEPARRAYRVVLQMLSAPPSENGIRYLPLDLPAGEIRFLCERQLARLPAGKPVTGLI